MHKILFLFLSLLLFGGCSFQSDELPSPSPDSNLISSSPPTLIPEQEEHACSDYPKTKRFLYVCHNWKEKDIDPRLDLPEGESDYLRIGKDIEYIRNTGASIGESDFLRDSLVFVLYPQKNGTARLYITSRLETEYSEWIDGEYIALGNHAYSFAVQYARCTEYGFDGCSTEPFATEGDILPGYFVIEEDTLYYLGQSDDFSNYDDYPACEFYFADELPTS